MRKNSEDLRAWLGFSARPNFDKAPFLGAAFGFLVVIFGIALVVATVLSIVNFFQALLGLSTYHQSLDGSAVRNTGLVVIGLLGAPFLVWRTLIASNQNRLAEESFYNEKMNVAAKDLAAQHETSKLLTVDGHEEYVRLVESDLVTRTAAIDRLEGLANERPELAPRLVKVLAAYVRGTFPAVNTEPSADWKIRATPRMDLQKSIDSIGQLLAVAQSVDPSHWRLDLRGCNLDGVDFSSGHFYATDFSRSRLEGAILEDVCFEGANLSGTLLNHCWFRGANLRGAKLDFCVLNQPLVNRGQSAWSFSLADNIEGLSLISSDISAIDHLGEPDLISGTIGTSETKVSEQVAQQMPSFADWQLAVAPIGAKTQAALRASERVAETGFQFWSPYTTGDMATGVLRAKLLRELDMLNWPYQ